MSGTPDRDRQTLEPTPKRVEEFRRRGEIALSRDLSTAATIGAAAIAGFAFAQSSLRTLSTYTEQTIARLGSGQAGGELTGFMATVLVASLPVVLGALAGFLTSTASQLGFPPAFAKLGLDVTRPFSLRGLGQIFALKAGAGRALKALAKVAFVGVAAWLAIKKDFAASVAEANIGAAALLDRLLTSSGRLAAFAGSAMLILAVLDYGLAKRATRAKMRMTPEEMKREMRDSDGDPMVKRRRRQRMRELSKRRLSAAVKSADVVVVNPTEYAVALRYRPGKDKAPRVVAKGRRAVAERIRQLARSAGIPILPQPPLARLLHKIVPEGREIPQSVYHAVAEVLAYVYRLKRNAR